jgi:hypothetical protein
MTIIVVYIKMKYLFSIVGEVKNWVTSYVYSSREQTIDLLDEGCHINVLDIIRPPLVISEWYFIAVIIKFYLYYSETYLS